MTIGLPYSLVLVLAAAAFAVPALTGTLLAAAWRALRRTP